MKSEQIGELASALCAAQKQIKGAIKDANNPFFKSKYADLTSTWEACKEALTSNGLSVVQTLQENSLETTLLHKSGQWISGACQLLNLKGDMQGLGSAISYARRYSLAAIVGVVTEDDDAESAGKASDTTAPSKEMITEAQAKMVYAKLAAKGFIGSDLYKWLGDNFKYPNNREIPYNKLNDVLQAIDKSKPFTQFKDPSEPKDVQDFDMPADKIFRK